MESANDGHAEEAVDPTLTETNHPADDVTQDTAQSSPAAAAVAQTTKSGPAPAPAAAPSKRTTKPASGAAPSGVLAKRVSRSGPQTIREANSHAGQLAAMANGTGMVTSLSLNAQLKTIPEEHAEFRARNNVRPTYRGPVFTVEDVSVPCHACGGPVDPVTRVPVGSLFFHASCLQCYLCGRRGGLVGMFVQVDRQAVCGTCAERGYEGCVPRQEAQSRGMVYGAIQGDVYNAMDAHDRGARQLPRLGGASARPVRSCATGLNRPTVPGALPPSLTIQAAHNNRNTSQRSFALMERQQYYTQSDNNLLMRMPDRAATASQKAGKAKSVAAAPDPQRITAAKNGL